MQIAPVGRADVVQHVGPPLRILISGYDCRPSGGSEGANAWFMALELARRGHAVVILSRTRDAPGVVAGIANAGLPPERLRAFFLSDHVPGPMGKGQLGVYSRYSAWQAKAARWMQKHREDFDIIHHVSWGSVTLPCAAAFAGLPYVLGPIGGGQLLARDHVQWLDGELGANQLRNTVLGNFVSKNPISRLTAQRAGLVLAANQETVALAQRLGAHQVLPQLPEGARTELLSATAVTFPSTPKVAWIGRFFPIKAAGLAVKAFRQALHRFPTASMVLIGDGPSRAMVMDGARDLINDGRVTFTGKLPWAAAQAELGKARLHIFSSVRDSSSAQTLEAATLGVPTVGLDAFGLKQFCHRPGFRLVDPFPGDTLDVRLGETISECLAWSPTEWEHESLGAQEFARENSYAAKAAAMERHYLEILGQG